MRKITKRVLLPAVLSVTVCGINYAAGADVNVGAGKGHPVVVELFTSEGCSSCPPADNLLGDLKKSSSERQEIITISEHVDYWNRLGWPDPFSSSEFTERQRKYSALVSQG